jgi:hypothetical protein
MVEAHVVKKALKKTEQHKYHIANGSKNWVYKDQH